MPLFRRILIKCIYNQRNVYFFPSVSSFPRMILKMPSIFLGCLLHGTSFTNKTKSALSK